MKKLLTFMGSSVVVATAALSVVACAEKPIIGLNDSSTFVKATDGTTDLIDVLKWDSTVISSDNYKSYFMTEFEKNMMGLPGSKSDLTFLDIVKGGQALDNGTTPETFNDEEKATDPYISQALVDYQKSSNTTDITNYDNPTLFSENLIYNIYDMNQNGDMVTSWNGTAWQDGENASIISKYNESTGVYLIHFKVGIVAKAGQSTTRGNGEALSRDEEASSTLAFTGARENISSDADLAQYYSNAKSPSQTNPYDYRFDVQFYLQLS